MLLNLVVPIASATPAASQAEANSGPSSVDSVVLAVEKVANADPDGRHPGDTITFITVRSDGTATILVTKTANPPSLVEPGGLVNFTVRIENISTVNPVTINSLIDNVHGNLNGQGTCSVPRVLAPGAFYECTFIAAVKGNAGYVERDVVSATGTDDDGKPLTDNDSATVTITNLPSAMRVTKSASPTQMVAPGGAVQFTIRVDNTSIADGITITSLVGSIHGNLNGQGTCSVPQTLLAGDSYQCTFTANVSGNTGDVETDTVAVLGTDDDGNPMSGSDDATVQIVAAPVTETPTHTPTSTSSATPTGSATPNADVHSYPHADRNPQLDAHGDSNRAGLRQLLARPVRAGRQPDAQQAAVDGGRQPGPHVPREHRCGLVQDRRADTQPELHHLHVEPGGRG